MNADAFSVALQDAVNIPDVDVSGMDMVTTVDELVADVTAGVYYGKFFPDNPLLLRGQQLTRKPDFDLYGDVAAIPINQEQKDAPYMPAKTIYSMLRSIPYKDDGSAFDDIRAHNFLVVTNQDKDKAIVSFVFSGFGQDPLASGRDMGPGMFSFQLERQQAATLASLAKKDAAAAELFLQKAIAGRSGTEGSWEDTKSIIRDSSKEWGLIDLRQPNLSQNDAVVNPYRNPLNGTIVESTSKRGGAAEAMKKKLLTPTTSPMVELPKAA